MNIDTSFVEVNNNISSLTHGASDKNTNPVKHFDPPNQFQITKIKQDDKSILSIAQQDNLPNNNFRFNIQDIKTTQSHSDTNLFDFIQKIQSQPDMRAHTVHNLKDIKNLELRSSQDYNGPSIQMAEQKLQDYIKLIH